MTSGHGLVIKCHALRYLGTSTYVLLLKNISKTFKQLKRFKLLLMTPLKRGAQLESIVCYIALYVCFSSLIKSLESLWPRGDGPNTE